MEDKVWQEVPGLPGTRIFPYIRKPDIVSSNSYLLADDYRIILIDPGGLPDQAAALAREIDILLVEQKRPVLLFLTHSHLDHCLQLMHAGLFQDREIVTILAHRKCADALQGQDTRATIADLMGYELKPVDITVRLFDTPRESIPGETVYHTADGLFVLHDHRISFGQDHDVWCQTVLMPGTAPVECYPAPGHSPDSICIRTGPLLFVGDLPFATNPGVAGLCGWDAKELENTIDTILQVIRVHGVETCCPGHGRVLDSRTALRVLSSMREETAALGTIRELSPGRVGMMAALAADIMIEIDRLFTILAGRFLFLVHVLEELEEAGAGDQIRGLVEAREIEEILADFHRFSEKVHAGHKKEIHLALKAGQIAARLSRTLEKSRIPDIIDPSYLQRINRLIEDYSVTFRGYDPETTASEISPGQVIGDTIRSTCAGAEYEEDLLRAEDKDAFLQALIGQIAGVNPLKDLHITHTGNPGETCLADEERFSALVRHLIETCFLSGGRDLSFAYGTRGRAYRITVRSPDIVHAVEGQAPGMRFIERSAALSGGSLFVHPDDRDALYLVFPRHRAKAGGVSWRRHSGRIT